MTPPAINAFQNTTLKKITANSVKTQYKVAIFVKILQIVMNVIKINIGTDRSQDFVSVNQDLYRLMELVSPVPNIASTASKTKNAPSAMTQITGSSGKEPVNALEVISRIRTSAFPAVWDASAASPKVCAQVATRWVTGS